jgi:YVTN family beta-propeller protein
MACTGTSAFVPRGLACAAVLLFTLACSSKPPAANQSQPAGAQKLSEASGGAVSGGADEEDGQTSNTVSVIDTQSDKVVASFLVDSRPRDAAFSPDGARAYVTTEIGRTVAVVDTAAHKVIHTIRVPRGENVKPMGVAVSGDGRRVYVATGRGNTVVVFDAASYEPVATIPVGQRVWGLALAPGGRKLYAANSLSNEVSVIDTATDRVIKTLKAGDGPWGIAVAPN